MDAFNLLLEMKLKRRRERPKLPRTVTELVAEDGSRVYVVGTAHFSDDSKRDVVKVSCHQSPPALPLGRPPPPWAPSDARPLQTIRAVQPDVVVVELCQYRVSMLKMDERTLLREAKELSLEKLQQAVRQVRSLPQALGAGRAVSVRALACGAGGTVHQVSGKGGRAAGAGRWGAGRSRGTPAGRRQGPPRWAQASGVGGRASSGQRPGSGSPRCSHRAGMSGGFCRGPGRAVSAEGTGS